MANSKSAAKRARQGESRYARNRWYRSRYRTFVKRARHYITAGDAENAAPAVRMASQAVDRAARRNVIHKNKASRIKSRLAKALGEMQA